LRTVDGGASWQSAAPLTAASVYALAAGGPERLWLGGGGGTILFTAEGALTDTVSGQTLARLPRPGSLTLADLKD
jgi:hypothetical protein